MKKNPKYIPKYKYKEIDNTFISQATEKKPRIIFFLGLTHLSYTHNFHPLCESILYATVSSAAAAPRRRYIIYITLIYQCQTV